MFKTIFEKLLKPRTLKKLKIIHDQQTFSRNLLLTPNGGFLPLKAQKI